MHCHRHEKNPWTQCNTGTCLVGKKIFFLAMILSFLCDHASHLQHGHSHVFLSSEWYIEDNWPWSCFKPTQKRFFLNTYRGPIFIFTVGRVFFSLRTKQVLMPLPQFPLKPFSVQSFVMLFYKNIQCSKIQMKQSITV